jgi:hypothetical protein
MLSVSVRTYRRRVAGILDSLGAQRFQAGGLAVRLGLTPGCDEESRINGGERTRVPASSPAADAVERAGESIEAFSDVAGLDRPVAYGQAGPRRQRDHEA